MAQALPENQNRSLELRFKRWTAVAVVCFMGLLAALPFRSTPGDAAPHVAPSHRERSLRFRAEAETATPTLSEAESRPLMSEPSSPPPKPKVTVAPAIHRSAPKPSEPIAAEKEHPTEPFAAEPSHGPAVEKPNSCVARRGENLMDIAERALGDRRRWKELMELNQQHRSAFDELTEGEAIVLPEDR